MTQSGNRRDPIFFYDAGQEVYRDLLAEQCERRGVACWSYRLMPDHARLILGPPREDAPSLAVGEAHGRRTSRLRTSRSA